MRCCIACSVLALFLSFSNKIALAGGGSDGLEYFFRSVFYVSLHSDAYLDANSAARTSIPENRDGKFLLFSKKRSLSDGQFLHCDDVSMRSYNSWRKYYQKYKEENEGAFGHVPLDFALEQVHVAIQRFERVKGRDKFANVSVAVPLGSSAAVSLWNAERNFFSKQSIERTRQFRGLKAALNGVLENKRIFLASRAECDDVEIFNIWVKFDE